jgi:hypothetical protein
MNKQLLSYRAKKKVIGIFPYLPLSKQFKEKHLDQIKARVANYQPKIEERTGINLGNIEVLDKREMSDELIREMIGEDFLNEESLAKKLSIPPEIYYFPKYAIISPLIRVLNKIHYDKAVMGYCDSKIYVDLNKRLRNQFLGLNPSADDDYDVVHELSHGLWEKLRDSSIQNDFEESKRELVWNEGFASYCEYRYFKDLLPFRGDSQEPQEGTIYYEGFKKVEETLALNGKEILITLPKRWREFEMTLFGGKKA